MVDTVSVYLMMSCKGSAIHSSLDPISINVTVIVMMVIANLITSNIDNAYVWMVQKYTLFIPIPSS